ncbi:MAG: OmpH family outer membrane protein [Rickettsiales bacterium]|nr:OmpH family outer membrane protein [Rickettsiales bacterium]
MKKIILTLILAFAVNSANAQNFDVKTIATVDLKKIVDESKAAKAAEEEVKRIQQKYVSETKSQEDALKKNEEQLKAQQKAMSQEAFAKKVQEFRVKLMNSQREVMKKRKILETAYIKALELVRNETIKIIAEIAKEKNVDVVIAKGQLLFAKDNYDISNEVLERLNKKLAKVNISVDKK